MTRAGEKLYREPDLGQGPSLWASLTHPDIRRGFRDVSRVIGTVLILLFVGWL